MQHDDIAEHAYAFAGKVILPYQFGGRKSVFRNKSKKLPEREGIRTPNRRNLFAPQPQHPHPLVRSVKLAQDESQAVGTIRLRLLHPPPSTAGTYRYRSNENKRRLTGSP